MKQILLYIFIILSFSIFSQPLKTDAVAIIFDTYDGVISKEKILKGGKFEVKSKDGKIYKVIEYKMATTLGGYLYKAECKSDTISLEALNIIKKQKTGRDVIFYQIKIQDKNKNIYSANPIILLLGEVNNNISDFTYEKVTILGTCDSIIKKEKLKTGKLELINKTKDKIRIERYKLLTIIASSGIREVFGDTLSEQMKSVISKQKRGRYVCFHDIYLYEKNQKTKAPPIFIILE